MYLRLFLRQISRILPLWPLKTLKKLFHLVFRGNTKYVILALCFTILLVFTSARQSGITLEANDIILREDFRKNNLKIQKYKEAEVVVRNIREYADVENEKKLNFTSSSLSSTSSPKPKRKKQNPRLCTNYSALIGNLTINPNITPDFNDVHQRAGKGLMKGGCYYPLDCDAEQKVAVIIPFKDREAHLKTLLYYLHPMLIRQKSHYCIYVAEQFDNGQFNKAMIMNAAFVEVMKLRNYDCIIFHDVDMIPENDKNFYRCRDQPRHLSPAIDKFNYHPHYGTDFGGVTAITPAQYKKANGHSNEFWGWGGEDNDMEFRIRYNGMRIIPSRLDVGRYKMIVHTHPWKFKPGDFPLELNKSAEYRAKIDGLSDLKYRMLGKTEFRSYTKLMLDIRRIDIKAITMFVDGDKAMSVDVPPEGQCRYVNYEGKYLDFKLELYKYKEAERFRPKEKPILEMIPEHLKDKVPPPRFTSVNTYADAEELCEILQPDCQGVQLEMNRRYTLRREGVPRDLVVTVPDKPLIVRDGKSVLDPSVPKHFVFPAKTAYLRYCPGGSGSIQKYETVIPVDLSQSRSKGQHKYGFEIRFSVLLQPTNYMYYTDTKLLEGTEKVHENLYTFKWPDGGPAPNFFSPNTPRDFVFRTDDFSFPTIPGCYGIESRIVNGKRHPYFQWLWWIDISSGNRSADTLIRSEYRTEVAHARRMNMKQIELKRNRKAQEQREYLFAKEMARIHKKPFVTKPELEEEQKEEVIMEKLNLGGDSPQFLLETIENVEEN